MILTDLQSDVVYNDVYTTIVNVARQKGKTTATIKAIRETEPNSNILVMNAIEGRNKSYRKAMRQFFMIDEVGNLIRAEDSKGDFRLVNFASPDSIDNDDSTLLYDLVIIEEAQDIKATKELKNFLGQTAYEEAIITGTMSELREDSLLGDLYIDHILYNVLELNLVQFYSYYLFLCDSFKFVDTMLGKTNLESKISFNKLRYKLRGDR